jgi:triosephosphate isomerase
VRKPIYAANWKMHKTEKEAVSFVRSFSAPSVSTEIEILIFPSTTSLSAVVEASRGSELSIGAQNMHWLESGPYTGETSPTMLLALGCTHVLIGHSERRRYFDETDETVNLKLKSALAHGLTPVVCVGENKRERDSGKMETVLEKQVTAALLGVTAKSVSGLIFAYEPIWAIGTGNAATPAIAEDAHKHIRSIVASILGSDFAHQKTRILYGGSVAPNNASNLIGLEDIDGALIGGASLDTDSFTETIRNAFPRSKPTHASAEKSVEKQPQGLFLADVDGTLLTSGKILTSRSIAAIQAIEQAGLAFTIVSGRPPRGMSFLIQQLKLKIPSAAFDGGAIIHPDLTIEKQRVLPVEMIRQTIELVEKYKMDYWIYRDQKWYVRDPDAPHAKREQWTVKFAPTVVSQFEGLIDQVNKLTVVSDEPHKIQALQSELQKQLGQKASATLSQDFYLDVTPVDANKGTVVDDLCKILKISPSSVVTIGDMPNDILMFKKSGFSIAMGNASAEVKKSTNYTTGTNDREGFAQAVEYFLKKRSNEQAKVA